MCATLAGRAMRNAFQDLFVMICAAGMGAFAAMLFRPRFRASFERRCVGSATAADLAFVRMAACGTLLLYLLSEDLASQGRMGTQWFAPPGYMTWLGRGLFDWFLSSTAHLRALTWLLTALLALGLVGCGTRVTVPLAAVFYLLFAALLRSFGKGFHEGYLGFYVLIVLCFTPCGDAWSADSRWLRPLWGRLSRHAGNAHRPTTAYGWAVYACYAAAVLPYLQLGLSKLASGGIFWFDGRSLRNYMLTDDLNLSEYEIDLALRFYDVPTILFTVAGFFSLLVELSYGLVLVVPRLRRVLPACVSLLHLGVFLGQDALFLDAILIPAIFIMPSRWLRGQTRSGSTGSEPAVASLEPITSRGPPPAKQFRAWLRGPYVPICLVLAMLFLDYTTFRNTIGWRWPVVAWQMYAGKANTQPIVKYRRFVAYYDDGSTEPISPGRAFAFLDKPYRLDRGLRRSRPEFLLTCLRELREREGTAVVGLAHETREWRYRERSLDEHLKEPPVTSFRVLAIEGPPAELRQDRSAGPSLLTHGDFGAWDREGLPRGWELNGAWTGTAIDPAENRAFMFAAGPSAQALQQIVASPEKVSGKALELRLQALVRSRAAGATIGLDVKLPGGEWSSVQAAAVGDGAWHRVEVSRSVAATPKPTQFRAVLRAPAAADVFYDDVRLFAVPAIETR